MGTIEAHPPVREFSAPAGATIGSLLQKGRADRVALSAPNRPPLSCEGLRHQIGSTVATLNRLGIGRNDRVAIVLPNGPELASAFLAIAAGASAAPLNPAYRLDDFRFYLSDLRAKAVVVGRGSQSPAVAAAAVLGVPVLELASRLEDPAGTFCLEGSPIGPPKHDALAQASDIALVLHTSGTTSRPKMVPLSQANLAASAGHIGKTLALTHEDRCLSMMPLFHIHGLIAGLLAPLTAGGEVLCVSGLNTSEIFHWMAEGQPTWYTAVPTMHQAMLARARENPRASERIQLRFIRSSSAALPPAVMRDLEAVFRAPVIESYGMTEAAHQMASNPLPPEERRAGSVGRAAGPEIALMDAAGELLPVGAKGEVVIRGPNVMAGYENNPEANAAAFTNGWFRTGDEGRLDENGYLTITARLKEIINRGGQKISPREIDDALLEYPGVAAAATFPMPHPTLEEEIGAALVIAQGATVTEQALTQFLLERLPEFKVPRRLVFVQDIPKGPTGKIQRKELAKALGIGGGANEPRAAGPDERMPTQLESRLSELWAQILVPSGAIGLHDEFFELGGDSLQAVELLALVEWKLGHSLPQSVFFEHGTIAKMAEYLNRQDPSDCVVPIQPKGTRPPFFCVSQIEGEVLSLLNLARRLGTDQPFFGIQAVGVDGKRAPLTRIEDMAAHYLGEVRKRQPNGPYYLGGYSMGGLVAYEMAKQLTKQGEKVGILALIDAYCGPPKMRFVASEWIRRRWNEMSRLRATEIGSYFALTLRELGRRLVDLQARAVHEMKWRIMRRLGDQGGSALRTKSVRETHAMAVWSYQIGQCDCDAVLFKTELNTWQDPVMHEGWKHALGRSLEVRKITGSHENFLNEPHVAMLAVELRDCLERRTARDAANSPSQAQPLPTSV